MPIDLQLGIIVFNFPSSPYQLHHFPHRPLQSHQHRPGDDGVADGEFLELRVALEALDISIIQTVAALDP